MIATTELVLHLTKMNTKKFKFLEKRCVVADTLLETGTKENGGGHGYTNDKVNDFNLKKLSVPKLVPHDLKVQFLPLQWATGNRFLAQD